MTKDKDKDKDVPSWRRGKAPNKVPVIPVHVNETDTPEQKRDKAIEAYRRQN